MSNLGLVFLLQLVRIVEIHDDTVHDQRLNRAGVERLHHAPDDVINITGRQVLSQRLQRGGGERRRVRIARTHFCDVVLPVRDCHFHRYTLRSAQNLPFALRRQAQIGRGRPLDSLNGLRIPPIPYHRERTGPDARRHRTTSVLTSCAPPDWEAVHRPTQGIASTRLQRSAKLGDEEVVTYFSRDICDA